jgi:hypothetical protein
LAACFPDSAEDQEEKQDRDGGTRVIRVFQEDLGAAEDAGREHDRGRDARAEPAGPTPRASAGAAPCDQRGQQDGERVGERAAEVHHVG